MTSNRSTAYTDVLSSWRHILKHATQMTHQQRTLKVSAECSKMYLVTTAESTSLPTELRRSQWPRDVGRTSAVARLLRLWVRIPRGEWTFVCCECCVCYQVEVSATKWSLVQRSPTDCGASLCVIYKPREWGDLGPRRLSRQKQTEPTERQAVHMAPFLFSFSGSPTINP